MELGEKLRRARLEKGLSQRQLCGERITRNMLSQIENGQAKPSMDTLRYLAAGLGKPVSYFLEENAVASPNLSVILEARRLFAGEKWQEALEMLKRYRPGDEIFDPEYWHLLSLCAWGAAGEAQRAGRISFAEDLLERSLTAGEKTLYGGAGVRARLLAAELRREDPTGLSQSLGALETSLGAEGERLALLLARQALNEGQSLRARVLMDLAPESSQKRLLYGESFLREKEYPQAAEQYLAAERLLEAVGGDPRVVYEPLEICFREMEDYKMAYFYAAKQK